MKKNILTISPYSEISEIGRKSVTICSNIHSIESVRAVHKNAINPTFGQNDQILIMNNSPAKKYDLCIQHVMPHLIAKVDVPTFSFYEPESYDNRCFDAWLQCADNVVVRSEEQKKALSEKIRQRAIVIPPSVDSGIKVGYKQVLDEFTFFVPNGKYNGNNREVLMAYLMEFGQEESVRLGIISSNPQATIDDIHALKTGMCLYAKDLFPEIKIYTDMGTMMSEGSCCIDVVSTLSYQPTTLLSMAQGIPSVMLDKSCLAEWLPEELYYPVESYRDVCKFTDNRPIEIQPARCEVNYPIIKSLRQQLRKAYDDRLGFLAKQKAIRKSLLDIFGQTRFEKEFKEKICL
tara:strand:+ start:4063 stop:5103 length:1041 start_codon:yes stop_codon:yes gene_type:complete